MFFRSAVTVSAMPEPIQSSAGSRVMFENVMTATALSSAVRQLRRRRREPPGSPVADAPAAAGRAAPAAAARGAAVVGSSRLRARCVQVDVQLARRLIAEVADPSRAPSARCASSAGGTL